MRVLFATSEAFPLAKTGGLADVSAALPAALADEGVEIRLLMPGYPQAIDRAHDKQAPIPVGEMPWVGPMELIPARMPNSGLPIWLVFCPALFHRPGGPYTDSDGVEWPDNDRRFAALSRIASCIALGRAGLAWQPELLHVNDWHLGFAPAIVAGHADPRPRTIMTIHNLSFQGLFATEAYERLGIAPGQLDPNDLEFYGRISFLKAGIRFADRLTTVSPTYAREILTPEFGCGLDGLLRWRGDTLEGILNGIDTDVWNPQDPFDIRYPFDREDLAGKTRCKAALQEDMGLAVKPAAPVLAFVSRLTEQKTADLLPAVAPWLVERGAQLVVLGTGDRWIEDILWAMAARHPGSVAVHLGYTETLAKRTFAGADMLLVPSRFEPCGLVQMYAMQYGALPIVRCTGGLADTVAQATGFSFEDASVEAMQAAIERALRRFAEPLAWRRMQLEAMAQDFSWRASAAKYRSLYESLCRIGPVARQADDESVARERMLAV